jgi:hypothetical protein
MEHIARLHDYFGTIWIEQINFPELVLPTEQTSSRCHQQGDHNADAIHEPNPFPACVATHFTHLPTVYIRAQKQSSPDFCFSLSYSALPLRHCSTPSQPDANSLLAENLFFRSRAGKPFPA